MEGFLALGDEAVIQGKELLSNGFESGFEFVREVESQRHISILA